MRRTAVSTCRKPAIQTAISTAGAVQAIISLITTRKLLFYWTRPTVWKSRALALPRGQLWREARPLRFSFLPACRSSPAPGGVNWVTTLLFSLPLLGSLNISTSGSFVGTTLPDGSRPTLLMSDSGSSRWTGPLNFTEADHAATPVELDNPNPAVISVAGDMNNLIFVANKPAQITVGGDMINAAFSGQNLHPGDVTSINVAGRIYNRSLYTFTTLSTPIVSADPRNPNQWDSIFNLLVDPTPSATLTPRKIPRKQQLQRTCWLPPARSCFSRQRETTIIQGLFTIPPRHDLGLLVACPILSALRLEGTLEILEIGPGRTASGCQRSVCHRSGDVRAGVGHRDPLSPDSQDVPVGTVSQDIRISGPGQFNHPRAASLDLGTTEGIQSLGAVREPLLWRDLTTSGAAINVNLDGDLTMFTSRIASLYGGDVTVNGGGSMDFGFAGSLRIVRDAFGIYTSGHSDVLSPPAETSISMVPGSRLTTGETFLSSHSKAMLTPAAAGRLMFPCRSCALIQQPAFHP